MIQRIAIFERSISNSSTSNRSLNGIRTSLNSEHSREILFSVVACKIRISVIIRSSILVCQMEFIITSIMSFCPSIVSEDSSDGIEQEFIVCLDIIIGDIFVDII